MPPLGGGFGGLPPDVLAAIAGNLGNPSSTAATIAAQQAAIAALLAPLPAPYGRMLGVRWEPAAPPPSARAADTASAESEAVSHTGAV